MEPRYQRYIANFFTEYNSKINIAKQSVPNIVDRNKCVIYFIELIKEDFLKRINVMKFEKDLVQNIKSYLIGRYREELKFYLKK